MCEDYRKRREEMAFTHSSEAGHGAPAFGRVTLDDRIDPTNHHFRRDIGEMIIRKSFLGIPRKVQHRRVWTDLHDISDFFGDAGHFWIAENSKGGTGLGVKSARPCGPPF